MGGLTLELVDSTGATLSTNAITTSITDPIVPGEDVTLENIYVKNTSDFPVYSIIKLRGEVTKSGETEPSLTYEKWMNLSNTEVVAGTTPADEISSNAKKQGAISLQIPYTLGNEYQGATLKLTYKALAVQKAHIPPLDGSEAQYACKYLYEEYMPRDISIKVGNNTAKTITLDGNTVADVSVEGVTTDNSCGWYYDAACTRPAYSTDVLTSDTELYTKSATTDKISTSSTTCIDVDPENTKYDSRDNCHALITTKTNTIELFTKSTSSIPTSITGLGNRCGFSYTKFGGIPRNITKIASNVVSGSELNEIIIPSSVTQMSNGAVYNANNLNYIYCEATSKPSGWNDSWNKTSASVYWYSETSKSGCWHYVNGEPVVWG